MELNQILAGLDPDRLDVEILFQMSLADVACRPCGRDRMAKNRYVVKSAMS
jgi:hypothetical protein